MTNAVQTIKVHTSPSYEVLVGSGLLHTCGTYLRQILPLCQDLLLCLTEINLDCHYICCHQTHSHEHGHDHSTNGHNGSRNEVDRLHSLRHNGHCAFS